MTKQRGVNPSAVVTPRVPMALGARALWQRSSPRVLSSPFNAGGLRVLGDYPWTSSEADSSWVRGAELLNGRVYACFEVTPPVTDTDKVEVGPVPPHLRNTKPPCTRKIRKENKTDSFAGRFYLTGFFLASLSSLFSLFFPFLVC